MKFRECLIINRYKYPLILSEDPGSSQHMPWPHGKADHLLWLADNLRSSGHSPQIMTGIWVVLLNCYCIFFPYDVSLWRQDFCESIPIVCIEKQSFKCSSLQYNFLTVAASRAPTTQATVLRVLRSRALMIHLLFFLNAGNTTSHRFRFYLFVNTLI